MQANLMPLQVSFFTCRLFGITTTTTTSQRLLSFRQEHQCSDNYLSSAFSFYFPSLYREPTINENSRISSNWNPHFMNQNQRASSPPGLTWTQLVNSPESPATPAETSSRSTSKARVWPTEVITLVPIFLLIQSATWSFSKSFFLETTPCAARFSRISGDVSVLDT